MNTFLKHSLIHFFIIVFFITPHSFGQKPTIGIKLGLSFPNATINQTEGQPNWKTSPRTSVLGGVYLNVPSGKKLIFRPGAEIVSKGFRHRDEFSSFAYPEIFTSIDFPINILYKINFTNGALMAGGGPVIGVPISEPLSQYPLKTEFSVNGLVGYEIAIGFSLNINYTYGLSNASKDHQLINKISNRYLGITAGYTF